MSIIIRCDSSYQIGHGHLMRCLNLAKKLGTNTTFLCCTLPENINSTVLDNQFKLIEFDQEHEDLNIIKEIRPDILIVDHYNLDINWENKTRKYCKKLIVIDDLMRTHSCDAVLDQNFRLCYDDLYNIQKTFLGPKYCLLKESFQDAIHKRPQDHKVMVFFGGSDPARMTVKFVKHFKKIETNYDFIIVAGSTNADLNELLQSTNEDPRFKLHIDIDYMDKLMTESTLFIGAGGTTTWERAKVGLPSIVVSIASNQEEINEQLCQAEIVNYLGRHQDVSMEDVQAKIENLLKNKDLYRKLKNNSLALQVGKGIKEFISYLKAEI